MTTHECMAEPKSHRGHRLETCTALPSSSQNCSLATNWLLLSATKKVSIIWYSAGHGTRIWLQHTAKQFFLHLISNKWEKKERWSTPLQNGPAASQMVGITLGRRLLLVSDGRMQGEVSWKSGIPTNANLALQCITCCVGIVPVVKVVPPGPRLKPQVTLWYPKFKFALFL